MRNRAGDFVSGVAFFLRAFRFKQIDLQRRNSEQNRVATAATRLQQKAVDGFYSLFFRRLDLKIESEGTSRTRA
jgi:hypothetical protein